MEDQQAALVRWIDSRDARSAAASDLKRYGLPHEGDHIDDVLHDVWLKVHDRLVRSPLEDRADGTAPNVAGYARRAVRNAVLDLSAGPALVSLDALFENGLGAQPRTGSPADHGDRDAFEDIDDIDGPRGFDAVDAEPCDGPGPVGTEDPHVEVIASCRRELHRRSGGRYIEAWVVSAALVPLAVSEGAKVSGAVPQPDPRSPGWRNRHLWSGLAYAGQARCFEEPETGAVRERRSRAIRRVDAILRAAMGLTGSGR